MCGWPVLVCLSSRGGVGLRAGGAKAKAFFRNSLATARGVLNKLGHKDDHDDDKKDGTSVKLTTHSP
jgi:hypothetical protein